MKRPTYIVADKWTGTWYFRRRVPKNIHDQVEHKLILRSLDTTDREKALRYGALLAVASETIFVHLQKRSEFVSENRRHTHVNLMKMLDQFREYWPLEATEISKCAAWITAWLRENDEEETQARMAYAIAKVQIDQLELPEYVITDAHAVLD